MTEMERLSFNFAKKAAACILMVLGSIAVGVGMLIAIPGNLLTIGGRSLCFRVDAWTYQRSRP